MNFDLSGVKKHVEGNTHKKKLKKLQQTQLTQKTLSQIYGGESQAQVSLEDKVARRRIAKACLKRGISFNAVFGHGQKYSDFRDVIESESGKKLSSATHISDKYIVDIMKEEVQLARSTMETAYQKRYSVRTS